MRRILIFYIVAVYCSEDEDAPENPLFHLATDNQIVIRRADGTYKMAYRHGEGFRAEVKHLDGSVQGVFSSPGDRGENTLNSYISDKSGYRLTQLKDLNLSLPPLPYYLHPQAGQRKFPKAEYEEKKEEAREEHVLPASSGNYQKIVLYPFGRLHEADAAVVVEPIDVRHQNLLRSKEHDDVILVGDQDVPAGSLTGVPISQIDIEDGDFENSEEGEEVEPGLPSSLEHYQTSDTQSGQLGTQSGHLGTQSGHLVTPSGQLGTQSGHLGTHSSQGGHMGNFPGPHGGESPLGPLATGCGQDPLLHVPPGTPVAQIKPSVTAIAGAGGNAQSAPVGTAIVGPGGISVSLPCSIALAGTAGLAISAPSFSSQAGPGGIAIAGGQSIAVAGILNPSQGLLQLGGNNLLGSGLLATHPTGTLRPSHPSQTGKDDKNQPILDIGIDKPGFLQLRSLLAPSQHLQYAREQQQAVATFPLGGTNIYPRVENYFFNLSLDQITQVLGTRLHGAYRR